MPALSALQLKLQQQQQGQWLVFTPSTSPVEKIARFIASLPTLSISWHYPDLKLSRDRLIVGGDVKNTSWPIKGMRGDGIKLLDIQMVFTETFDSYDVQVTANGEISIGMTKILLRGELQNDNRFFFTLHDSLPAWLPLSRLVAFASDSRENEELYHPIQKKTPLKELQVTRFQVALGYEETAQTDLFLEAVPAPPATWEMINKDGKFLHKKSLVLENVAVQLRSSYVPRWHQFVFKGAIVGRLPIGVRTFPAVIPLHGGAHWECSIQPDEKVVPDLLTLAQWEDMHVDSRLRAALFVAELDAQEVFVDDIVLGFDAKARELKYVATRNHAETALGWMSFSVFLPDVQVNGHLSAADNLLTMKKLVEHYFTTAENFPHSSVCEVTLDVDSAKLACTLRASIEEGGFQVGLLSLKQPRLTITRSQEGVEGLLLANCTVADVNVPLVCPRRMTASGLTVTASTQTGWQVQGEAEEPIAREKLFEWLTQFMKKEDLIDLHALGETVHLVVEGDLAANTQRLTCTDGQKQSLIILLTRIERDRFKLHVVTNLINSTEAALPDYRDAGSGYDSDASVSSQVSERDDEFVLGFSDDETSQRPEEIESEEADDLFEESRKRKFQQHSPRSSKRRRFHPLEGDMEDH